MLDIIVYAVLLCPVVLLGHIVISGICIRSLKKDVKALWSLLEEDDESEE